MLAALRAFARRGAPAAARTAAAAPRLTRPTWPPASPPAARSLAGWAGRTLRSLPLLPPFAARGVATKQPKAGGAKMKSLSCWKRRFKVGAAGLVRMRAGHRHKRAVKPPHVRRRLRSRTGVHAALAKKMVVRGFTRERLC